MLKYEMMMLINAAIVFLVFETLLLFRNKKILEIIDVLGDIPTTMKGFFLVNFVMLMFAAAGGMLVTGVVALILEVPKILGIICAVIIGKIILAKIFLRKSKE